MTRKALEKIVHYLVDRALDAIQENTSEKDLPVDYLGIFAKNEQEFTEIERLLSTLGKFGDKTATASGMTVVLDEPFETAAGPLKVLKIRKPDSARPQRGAPDFLVSDYPSFKERYFLSGDFSNFSLMMRKTYEMLELKGDDVLVYFPSKSFRERQT